MEDGPLMAWEKPGDGPVVYLSAGMHGDEPAGPLAALEMMERGLFGANRHWLICPAMNPGGLALHTRENRMGKDLNRDYLKQETLEVAAHIRWLSRKPVPDLFVSLHEDWESTGFYFYEINCGQDRPEVAHAILSAASDIMPVEPEVVIDEHEVREAGWIFHCADADMPNHWPEAIYLAKKGSGPTREAIDPVRYLTNRSSGKMGYAIAEAAVAAGHQVLLVSGPTSVDVPDGVDYLPVESADEMYRAVESYLPRMQAAFFSAAVADYTPARVEEQKIKKSGDEISLNLVRTKDILGAARSEFGFTGFLAGFAAETENLESNARAKLERKGCDLIVANDVSRRDIGFDSDENEALLVFADRTEHFPKAAKHDLACHLVSMLAV
eukprot:g3455.t1